MVATDGDLGGDDVKINKRFLRVVINDSIQKIRIGTAEHNIKFEQEFGWVVRLSIQHGYKYYAKEWSKF